MEKEKTKGRRPKTKKVAEQEAANGSQQFVTIYVMGEAYQVPKELTIMKAMEYAGYRFIRGCGCRGGFCGACGTVYRTRDSYKLKVGLACQTVVEDGMYLTQIPFYPANKKIYNIEELKADTQVLVRHYPELMRCIACNSCTKICPQDIDVMGYVQAAIRGDIARVADMSFDCIMCGLCASRCPAEIVHYNVALLARRLYGAKIAPRAAHLQERLKEIEAGAFEPGLDKLTKMSEEELSRLYYEARDIEPE
ncbi:MAG: 4Fe-4S dicluster domain-containing protein [candidate division WOR-3 bacterium]|jgi:ferredoxin|nr:4Fe-4S dicluster domain-containing protein [candidate division WOR-3 bacterium]MCR4424264.1 4Fe-4S dicluster domain-containing protein [candidate division WOR-3 bacterium]MDH7519756.1 4Fe-4S dicluster domain-containing protein [bacterium]